MAFRLADVLAAGILLAHAAVVGAGQAPAPPAPARAGDEHVEVHETLLTPTTDDVSGTAWLPRATPMYGVHRSWHGWDLRLDGALFVEGIYEPGDRHRTGGAGTHQVASVNWGMVMARRRVGEGRVGLRAMVSAEPLTVPGCGALNLVATGEVCDGDTIHDCEQPHDLVSELAVDYEHPLRGSWRWDVYAGLAGDPAYGPPPHPHRLSAAFNPIAPVTHHWIEPSAAFGVVTAGIHNGRWKSELSAFNSRAPDERRTDLDLGSFDAVSARVSYLPTDRVALQASVAHLQDARGAFEQPPDPAGTLLNVSATYHRPLAAGGLWASTVAGGLRRGREGIPGGVFDAANGGVAAETSLTVAARDTILRSRRTGRDAGAPPARARVRAVGLPDRQAPGRLRPAARATPRRRHRLRLHRLRESAAAGARAPLRRPRRSRRRRLRLGAGGRPRDVTRSGRAGDAAATRGTCPTAGARR